MTYARYKMCIFGDGGVGKTTLINRYLSGKYSEDFKMTIGVDFYTKNIIIEDINVSLQIWDFAGEQQFKNLLPNYVIGATGGIYMYDISRFYSITHLEEWINLLDKAPDKQAQRMPLLLVGGKKDLSLDGKRVVETSYAYEQGQKFGVFDFIECSSKTGENIEQIFYKMARKMLENSRIL
jgi:Ras-related protein Rab-7A